MDEMSDNKQSLERKRWPFWAGALIFFLGGTVLLPDVLRPGVTQPVAFDHKIHTEEAELECEDCHSTVRTRAFAGLPTVAFCMECHEEAQTDSPHEARLREYAEKGKEVAWVRMFRQPGHVNYSHRRHVALAKISCDTCHGEIGIRSASDTRWPANLTMDDCMDCHTQKEAGLDCTDCHR
jgi:hypothetical protein